MDFGAVLDDWDRLTAKSAGKKSIRDDEKKKLQASLDEKENPPLAEIGAGKIGNEKLVDPMTAWLRVNGVMDKDAEEEDSIQNAAAKRRYLRAKAPDATIDLHGLTRDEAWLRLSAFFADSRRHGAEKILIVHGKGNHSEGEAILKRVTRDFIERCAFAGESGQADARSGGSGASWVLLKHEA
ncbi:Smr/MutS family protein [Treponema sp.]